MKRINKLKSTLNKGMHHVQGISAKVTSNIAGQCDINDEGKVNLDDAKIVAGNIKSSVSASLSNYKAEQAEKSYTKELNKLNPIFEKDINNFSNQKIIRLADKDIKYTEYKECNGAIGYKSDITNKQLISYFRESVDMLPYEFYPNINSDIYYIDPVHSNRLIAIDDYFIYLKQARIAELQCIAQDLGAKHFVVTYKEEENIKDSSKMKGKAGAKSVGTVSAEASSSSKSFTNIEIAAENEFPGHAPIEPNVNYFKGEPAIASLIKMRLANSGALTHQKILIKMSNSTGINKNAAMEIDAIVNKLKCSASFSVEKELMKETQRYLEYEIEF